MIPDRPQRIVGSAVIGRDLRRVSIALDDGVIARVEPARDRPSTIPDDQLIVPGFIDLQINGGFGFDFTSGPDMIWRVGSQLPRFGVTSFLPTIITSPPATWRAAYEALASRPSGYEGAEPLGLHIEGPLIAPSKRGTHPLQDIAADALGAARQLIEAKPRLVTLAPDADPDLDATKALREADVVVSVGHTDASSEQCRAVFDAGATMATHLFNAMSQMTSRAPGVVGAVLSSHGPVASIIADGVHVSPEVASVAWRCLGPERLALVSDAMAGLGLSDGSYRLASVSVSVAAGEARNDSGGLAGGVCPLDVMLANLRRWTQAPIEDMVACVTSTPARVVGEKLRGTIAAGSLADLTILDRDMQCVATLVGGKRLWARRRT